MNTERILDSQTLKGITHKGREYPQADMDAIIDFDSMKNSDDKMNMRQWINLLLMMYRILKNDIIDTNVPDINVGNILCLRRIF